ncbi:MAG TPA: hypothetical protein VK449_12135 [Anaerolineales bacterium]|nr:hypothetical protein [Anaerolineales bacterium]
MASGYAVRRNAYYDSVFLMGVSQRLGQLPGVQQTAALMASEQNKALLADIGIEGDDLRHAGANDLVVAVIADSPTMVAQALAGLDDALRTVRGGAVTSERHTLQDGLEVLPAANLALLTIPGGYVPREARRALESGLNLFIFSSNVPVEEERRLKELARGRNLLVMGPDCGTSIVNGVGLGFANVVRRGTIGVIGPSGTGLQEFTCQVHHAGRGISHAIGTGSRDLSDEIGGLTSLTALDRLERDPRTEVIAVVAKPAGVRMGPRLIERLEACPKPVVACLLGATARPASAKAIWAETIDAAAEAAIHAAGGAGSAAAATPGFDERHSSTANIRSNWTPRQRYLRGLFAGGTLCYQSQQILSRAGQAVFSNAPLRPEGRLAAADPSREHTLIDMGDEAFTLGRLHPMIDGSLRRQRVVAESLDPTVAILLLDFVLGRNASADPVGDVLEGIEEGQRRRPPADGRLAIVASVCGTEDDPQDMRRQVDRLRDLGAAVFSSNARATAFCLDLLGAA